MNNLTVEMVWQGKRCTHWRVSRGQKGGEGVTVRVSDFGIYVCLTCRVVDCIHAKAVESIDRRQPAVA